MALKVYKPTTPGRRGMTAIQGEKLTKKKPEKSLTGFHLRTGGRNNDGRLTIRFRGEGTSAFIARLIFGVTRLVFPQRLPPLNTTQIALQELRCCIILMVRSGISWLLWVCRWVIWCSQGRRRSAAGECSPARQYASGYHHSQHRAEAW